MMNYGTMINLEVIRLMQNSRALAMTRRFSCFDVLGVVVLQCDSLVPFQLEIVIPDSLLWVCDADAPT